MRCRCGRRGRISGVSIDDAAALDVEIIRATCHALAGVSIDDDAALDVEIIRALAQEVQVVHKTSSHRSRSGGHGRRTILCHLCGQSAGTRCSFISGQGMAGWVKVRNCAATTGQRQEPRAQAATSV